MATYFISDLHLDPKYPVIKNNFIYFLNTIAPQAEALYILGDLFEVWIGDDHQSKFNKEIIRELNLLSKKIPVYFMHGNRDFIIGTRFCQEAGCQLIQDPTIIDLYGQQTLLMHGDTLCTDDHKYIEIRKKLRDPEFQKNILAKPLWMRKIIALFYRLRSKRHIKNAPTSIMDVNIDEVNNVMQNHQIKLLIHGHTHRPAIHQFENHGQRYERVVLSDWGDEGNYLKFSNNGNKNLRYFNCENGITKT